MPPLNAETMPREVTWNPELEQLCYAPIEEQKALRGARLPTPSGAGLPVSLAPAVPQVLGPWPGSVGNQSEIEVTFALPTKDGVLGVVVMAGKGGPGASGVFFFVDYTAAGAEVATGSAHQTVVVGAMMNRTQAGFTCGAPGVKCANDTLQLTARDTHVTIRAFVDNNFVSLAALGACCGRCCRGVWCVRVRAGARRAPLVGESGCCHWLVMVLFFCPFSLQAECYFQDNRVAITVPTPPTQQAAVAIVSTVPTTVAQVDAWRVNGIWVSEEQLLATPRPDAA